MNDEPLALSRRASAVLAVVAVAILAGNVILAIAAIRSDQTDVIGVEYAVTHPIQRLALGHPLYADPEEPPFSLIQYTPLHYQVSTGLLRTIGGDANDPAVVTRFGRISAAGAWAGALFVVGSWLLRLGVGPALALALLAWWTTESGVWWFLNRPDSAQTFLLFVALAMMARSVLDERTSWMWLVAASIAGVAAGYAKQNGWFGSVVFVAFLLADCRRKAAAFAILATVIGHALLHFLAWRAWGSAWPMNILGALDNGVWFSRAVVMAYQPVAFEASALLALAVVLAWHGRRSPNGWQRFLATAFLLLLLFAAVTALKVGSAENYFIDVCGVAVLLIGGALAAARREAPAIYNAATLVAAAALLLYGPVKLFESRRRVESATSYAPLRPVGERLTRLLADKPGAWAFAADGRVACFEPERTILPQLLLAYMGHERHCFSYASLRELFARGEVAVIVLPSEWGDDPETGGSLLGAPFAGFRVVDRVSGWRFYLHRRYAATSAR